MADPFSIASGGIGIVAEAVNKIKELVNFINDIKDTPNTVRQLKDELSSVEAVLQSLRGTLERDTGSQSWTQLLRSSNLVDAIKTLRTNCNAFKEMLQTWTKRSGSGNKFSFRNSLNTALSQSKISAMLIQLDRYKQTVTMALGFCALQNQLHDMQVTDIALDQLHSDPEFIAKVSVAARTEQSIGKVSIFEQGYGSVGMTNMNEVLDVKQKIGDVNVGKAGTAFVGIHNNVDRRTALANRWDLGNRS